MENYLVHFGTPKHSGRYPYGSGDDPYQGRTRSDRQPMFSRALERLTRTKRNNENTNAKLAAEKKDLTENKTVNEIRNEAERYKAIAEYYSAKTRVDELYTHYRKSRNEAGFFSKLINSQEPKYQMLRTIVVDPLKNYATNAIKAKLGLNDKNQQNNNQQNNKNQQNNNNQQQNNNNQQKDKNN